MSRKSSGASETVSAAPSKSPRSRVPSADSNNGWLLCLLFFATFVAYLPVWRAGFIWDDDRFLTENPLIHQAGGLWKFWFSTAAPDYFPLTSTTLWFEWRLWGKNALGYHLINVLLHAASAALWWRVLVRLKIPGAWLAAAIFALHPVNVESVAWITERKNTLAMLFHTLTLLWFLKFEESRRPRCYRLSLLFFTLALLSKTAVAPLPFVLLGIAWWKRGRIERADLFHSLPFFFIATVMGLVTIWFQYHQNIGSDVVRVDDLRSRLAGAGWAILFYLGKVVVPLNLSFVYPSWRIDPEKMISYAPISLSVIALLIFWFFRRSWGKALLFGFGYFALLLLPILGFFNVYFMLYSLVADHWQYFSIIGPIALFAAGSVYVGEKIKVRSTTPFAVILLLVLGTLTWRQTKIYSDPQTLWRDTLRKNPTCWMAENNLANFLSGQGRIEQSVPHYERALVLKPDLASAHYNYGLTLGQLNRMTEAIDHLQQAVKLDPQYVKAHHNLGIGLARLGRIEEAVFHFQQAVALDPQFTVARLKLAMALDQTGKTDDAIRQLREALSFDPENREARNFLGNLQAKKKP